MVCMAAALVALGAERESFVEAANGPALKLLGVS